MLLSHASPPPPSSSSSSSSLLLRRRPRRDVNRDGDNSIPDHHDDDDGDNYDGDEGYRSLLSTAAAAAAGPDHGRAAFPPDRPISSSSSSSSSTTLRPLAANVAVVGDPEPFFSTGPAASAAPASRGGGQYQGSRAAPAPGFSCPDHATRTTRPRRGPDASSSPFCANCIHNQNLVLQLLSAYDPDDDEFFEETASAYRSHLESIYPFPCPACAERVAAQIDAADRRVRSWLFNSRLYLSRAAAAGRRHWTDDAPAVAHQSRWWTVIGSAGWLAAMAVNVAVLAATLVLHFLGIYKPITVGEFDCMTPESVALDRSDGVSAVACIFSPLSCLGRHTADLLRLYCRVRPQATILLLATAPMSFFNPLRPWRRGQLTLFGKWRMRLSKQSYLLAQLSLLVLRISAFAILGWFQIDALFSSFVHLAFLCLVLVAVAFLLSSFSIFEAVHLVVGSPHRKSPSRKSSKWTFSPPKRPFAPTLSKSTSAQSAFFDSPESSDNLGFDLDSLGLENVLANSNLGVVEEMEAKFKQKRAASRLALSGLWLCVLCGIALRTGSISRPLTLIGFPVLGLATCCFLMLWRLRTLEFKTLDGRVAVLVSIYVVLWAVRLALLFASAARGASATATTTSSDGGTSSGVVDPIQASLDPFLQKPAAALAREWELCLLLDVGGDRLQGTLGAAADVALFAVGAALPYS
ncbi:hypothetical protein DFJ73DRAFT_796215 [Zopfochytrium polystomum]|nr:hypothetical protein DFJ73DRAFT_796215 [Zopfochytrium polystomum]